MAIIQKKTKTVIKGRPLGGAMGAYADMEKKAKAGDAQAKADKALELEKQKTFGEGPGSGPSGAMPQSKKKMGGKVVKKAAAGASLKKVPAGNAGLPKLPKDVRNKIGFKKQGGAVKKCKNGCK